MIEMENDFMDEAGMVLAEALKMKNPFRISSSVDASNVHKIGYPHLRGKR
jgi:hypothetical protein